MRAAMMEKLARLFHRIAGCWRGKAQPDLRIPRRAKASLLASGGGARCRELPASSRAGQRYKTDFGMNARKPCRKQLVNELGAGLVKYRG
jgi:hypothetical protein